MLLLWFVHFVMSSFSLLSPAYTSLLVTEIACVQVNFAPQFVAADGNATLKAVADHIEHIGAVAGRKQCIFLIYHRSLYCAFSHHHLLVLG